MMKPSQFAVELGVLWNRLAPELTFGVFINKFELYLFTLNVSPLELSNGAYISLLEIFYEAKRDFPEEFAKYF